MKVILVKDVDSLGETGDVKDVTEGFALNYLFAKKLAVRASEGAMKDLNARKAGIEQKAEKKRQEDQANADKVAAISPVRIQANAHPDSGKLYGAITTKELAAIIEQKAGLKVERKQVNVNAPINQLGDYTVYVKFSAKVSAEFGVIVEANKDENAA